MFNLQKHAKQNSNDHSSAELFRKLNSFSLVKDTDSYKMSQYLQYPEDTDGYFGYIESRGGKFDSTVFFGLQYYLKQYLSVQVTSERVLFMEEFAKFHGEPFNREGWDYIVSEHNGYLPISVSAVPEGKVVPVHNALVTIETTDPKVPWIAGYVETMLLRVWYPITVATLSYEVKKIISSYHQRTAGNVEGVPFSLHDFGSRGVSSYESAQIGGAAHLVNFLGSDTIAGVTLANLCYGSESGMLGLSLPACYDETTELLTEQGWQTFQELQAGTKVAQYEESGAISFVPFTNLVNEYYKGDMIRLSSDSKVAKVDQLVTPNHRVIRRSRNSGKTEVMTAEDVTFSQKNSYLQGGVTSVVGRGLSDIERLKIAFQADGSFPNRRESYTGERSGKKPIRFSLAKKRKVDRLVAILDRGEIEYTLSVHTDGRASFWIKTTEEMSKTLDWVEISKVSAQWCQAFIEEVSYWDGCVKCNTTQYSSIEEFNANVVSEVALLAGYRSYVSSYVDPRSNYNRKEIFNVSIAKKANYRTGQKIRKEVEQYSGQIGCVTVPSGMLVVRRGGCCAISGNSEHSTITSWGKENESDAYQNMINKFGGEGKIFACVSDSYDIYNAIENLWGGELKQAVIDSGATLVIRPDSGDPCGVVLKCLELCAKSFGYVRNKQGYKVLKTVKIMQGDGVNIDSIEEILIEMSVAGFCATNIAFGMGGALLQKVNRDTQKFAMKCSAIRRKGLWHDVYKDPITDKGKASKKGKLMLYIDEQGNYSTKSPLFPHEGWTPVLKEVFRDGRILREYTMDEVRANTGSWE